MTPEQFKKISNAIQQLKTLSKSLSDMNLNACAEHLDDQLITDLKNVKMRVSATVTVLQSKLDEQIENAKQPELRAIVAKCGERILNLVSIINHENIKFDMLVRDYNKKYEHFKSTGIAEEKIALILEPVDDAVKAEHRQKIEALQLEQEKLSEFINDFPRYDTSSIEPYLANLA